MAETNLADRVRQYGEFLDESMGKIQGPIRELSQRNPNTRGGQEDARKLSELYGQETAYRTVLREFLEKFSELYRAEPKTE